MRTNKTRESYAKPLAYAITVETTAILAGSGSTEGWNEKPGSGKWQAPAQEYSEDEE